MPKAGLRSDVRVTVGINRCQLGVLNPCAVACSGSYVHPLDHSGKLTMKAAMQTVASISFVFLKAARLCHTWVFSIALRMVLLRSRRFHPSAIRVQRESQNSATGTPRVS